MIDLLPLLSPASGTAGAPLPTSLVGSDGAASGGTLPSFGETFGQFLDARDAATDRTVPLALSPAPLPTLPRGGQEAAADGKKLPAAPGSEEGRPDARPDVAPAWFPPLVVAPPVVTALPPADAGDPAAIASTTTALPSPAVPSARPADVIAGQETAEPSPSPDAPSDAAPQTRTRKTGRFAAPAAPRPADRRPTVKERDSAPATDPTLTAPITVRLDPSRPVEKPVPVQAASRTGDLAPDAATLAPTVTAAAAPVAVAAKHPRQPGPAAPRDQIRTPDAATLIMPMQPTEFPTVTQPNVAAVASKTSAVAVAVVAPVRLPKSRITAPDLAAAPTPTADPAATIIPTRTSRQPGAVARDVPAREPIAPTDAAAVAVPVHVLAQPGTVAPDVPARAPAMQTDATAYGVPTQTPSQPVAAKPDIVTPDIAAPASIAPLDPATPIMPLTAQVAAPSPAPTFLPSIPPAATVAPPLPARPAAPADKGPAVAAIRALPAVEPLALASRPAGLVQGITTPSIAPPAATPSTPDAPIDRAATASPASTDPVIGAAARPTSPPAPIAAAQPQPAIIVSSTPQPAGRVFAAAFATAAAWRERAGRTPARDLADTATTIATTPLAPPERAVVRAAAEAQGAPLDLTRDSGLHRMIDRIETLRDAAGDMADVGDTRIRLIPDALGSVEIAVRQEGDRVHVRFTAEQEATRVLIADAQPRLTELAAARGVRIGETSVGTGGGDAAGNPATPQPRPASLLARAPRSAASDDAATTEHRLA